MSKAQTQQVALARVTGDRRRENRRQGEPAAVVTTSRAFDREERMVFKRLERRRTLRRTRDIQRAVAQVG